jgi:uncharacterized protein (DUF4415 family)
MLDNEIQQFCDDLLESVSQMNANERASETVVKIPRKVSAMIEVDDDVLDAFRKTGSDWQIQINHVLKQWLQTHSLEHSVL